MARLIIEYDAENSLANSIIDLIHEAGVFKIMVEVEKTDDVKDFNTGQNKLPEIAIKNKGKEFPVLNPGNYVIKD